MIVKFRSDIVRTSATASSPAICPGTRCERRPCYPCSCKAESEAQPYRSICGTPVWPTMTRTSAGISASGNFALQDFLLYHFLSNATLHLQTIKTAASPFLAAASRSSLRGSACAQERLALHFLLLLGCSATPMILVQGNLRQNHFAYFDFQSF